MEQEQTANLSPWGMFFSNTFKGMKQSETAVNVGSETDRCYLSPFRLL